MGECRGQSCHMQVRRGYIEASWRGGRTVRKSGARRRNCVSRMFFSSSPRSWPVLVRRTSRETRGRPSLRIREEATLLLHERRFHHVKFPNVLLTLTHLRFHAYGLGSLLGVLLARILIQWVRDGPPILHVYQGHSWHCRCCSEDSAVGREFEPVCCCDDCAVIDRFIVNTALILLWLLSARGLRLLCACVWRQMRPEVNRVNDTNGRGRRAPQPAVCKLVRDHFAKRTWLILKNPTSKTSISSLPWNWPAQEGISPAGFPLLSPPSQLPFSRVTRGIADGPHTCSQSRGASPGGRVAVALAEDQLEIPVSNVKTAMT